MRTASSDAERKALYPVRNTRRNIRLTAVNHFFVEGAMTLCEPESVLTLFVKEVSGSTFLASLMPTLRYFGWLAPQFVVAGHLQRFRRFVPVTLVFESFRFVLYLAIAAVAGLFGLTRPMLTMAVFFGLFAITRVAAGSSAVARTELVARMVPSEERASVISARRLSGGVAGFLAGLLVRFVLSERVLVPPYSYAILMGISGLAFGLAMAVLTGIVEPNVPIKPRSLSIRDQFRRAPSLLRRDKRYRLYTLLRGTSTGLTLAAPFYILFATEKLGVAPAMAGVYISVRTLMRVLSNVYWGRQCRARSSVWVLSVGNLLGLLVPVIVILLSLVSESPRPIHRWAFGAVFAVQGLAVSAQGIGQTSCLYDIAPERDRLTYFGLANTIIGPLYFLPAIGGAMVERMGYMPIFAVSAAMLAGGFLIALRLSRLCRQPLVST